MANIDKLYEWYKLRRSREFLETYDKEAAWNKIQQQIKRQHRQTLWKRYGSIAAVVLILLGCGWWWTENSTNSVSKELYTLRVPIGEEYTQKLADGTQVVINAGTKLKYPKKFEHKVRKVELLGEAFFSVTHDASTPFVVSTPLGTIEVLGTRFNVVADPNQTTVTLEEGSVRLRSEKHELLMKPGEQACIKRNGEISLRQVNTTNYTSWSTGTYDFHNATLYEITRQLSLWYNVSFTIADPEIGEGRYTGVIMRNESLQDALNMLSTISELKFIIQDNKIEVVHN